MSQITIKLSQAVALRDVLTERAQPLAVMFVADTTDTTKVSKFIIFFMHGADAVFTFSAASEMSTINAFKSTFPNAVQVEAITA
jgi:hypothetical protein